MKTSLILAVVSALPLLAQEPAPQQETPAAPQGEQAPPRGCTGTAATTCRAPAASTAA